MDIKEIIRNFITPKKQQTNGRQPVGALWGASNQGMSSVQSLGFGINMDGSVKVGLNTYYTLIRKSWVISSGIRLLATKVGGYGIYFVNAKGVTVEADNETIANVKRFFSVPQIRSYIYTSICNYIIAGQKIATATKLNKFGKATDQSKVNILDPRMLVIKTDNKTGEITGYEYRNEHDVIEIPVNLVSDDILFPDLNRDGYGQSMMESIVVDGLTDLLTGNRQFHLYRNNATPGTVYILDKESVDDTNIKDLEMKINDKFGGNTNAGKPLASTTIKDVKTIEIPKLDTVVEREMLMKIVSTVLGLDPRVIGFMKDNGAFAEIDSIARTLTNAKLEERTNIMETAMNQEYEQFVGPLPYRIKLDTIYYKNEEKDKEMALKEVEKGILTIEQYKTLFNI